MGRHDNRWPKVTCYGNESSQHFMSLTGQRMPIRDGHLTYIMEGMMITVARIGLLASMCVAIVAAMTGSVFAEEGKSPAEGYTIHVQAPHVMEDGTVGGPFHHYCKGISKEILQCLLFDSTDSNAKLVAVEYFVAKDLSRKEIPLIMWHRHYHDHKVEIETGRVQVIEPADKAKEIAEAASKTDGIIFHLWQKDDKIPTGRVTYPQSVGHEFPRK